MFSSATAQWATPQDFFDKLDKVFNFTLDVCALPENAKCSKYYTPTQDGLKQEWKGVVWMNPPYGREIGKWIEKASLESNRGGVIVVALLPARTDTRWFHDFIYNKAKVEFVKGRLKFGNSKNSAPFPSMIVIFNPTQPPIQCTLNN